MGTVEKFTNFVNAVINEKSFNSTNQYINNQKTAIIHLVEQGEIKLLSLRNEVDTYTLFYIIFRSHLYLRSAIYMTSLFNFIVALYLAAVSESKK